MDHSNIRAVVVLGSDPASVRETAGILTESGLRTERCKDAGELLSRLGDDDPPRLILLLAAGWPLEDTLNIVRRIRAVSSTPCILLAGAPDQDDHCARGFESGLDDWAPHDATIREILARIRAVLRRSRTYPAAEAQLQPMSPLAPTGSGTWKLSQAKRDVITPTGHPCHLTVAEFELVATLLRHRGSAVSREALSQAVFQRAWQAEDRGIDNLVARLRRKLASKTRNTQVVKPVRGVGYLFTGF